MFVFVDLGRALREAFFMFWETLWPLVLGFGLSGAVQAFVSRRRIERVMGDHGPASVVRASAFGMVSSSCSYAASAMAKSLFQKGADFVAAMVFMFASTNLVVELGIVLVVLLGWQFAVAEFVGGPIMIVLLALFGGFVLTPRLIQGARARLRKAPGDNDHDHDHDHELAPASRPKVTSVTAWADAASYTVADLSMLRRELVIGYVVAGVLAVL
ncbi:MAG TPA: permease, partial [Acidimicrobiales bacterium]|nr:permease [Acidimicrobiales bacterium]